jgi:hypothetical protein
VAGAPDLAAPVTGWRLWLLDSDDDGPVLTSPVATSRWPAREATTASCRAGCERPPAWECGCGLYATAHVGRLLTTGVTAGLVLGCTALWGRVVEATEGWRAERGYPLVLFAPTVDRRDRFDAQHAVLWRTLVHRPGVAPQPDPPDEATLRALARRYAVPAHPVPTLRQAHAPRMDGPATVLRDEAARGLAARRLGDGHARRRFDRAVDDLLAALDRRPPPELLA